MKKNIFIVVLLVVIIVLGVLVYKNQGRDRSAGLAPQVAKDDQVLYEYPGGGFGFSYPSVFVRTLNERIYLPGATEEAIPASSLVRRIAVPHYSMSGDGSDETENPRINIAVAQATMAELLELAKDYDRRDDMTIAGKQAAVFTAGVEGEGIYYYFIPFTADQTIVLTRSYIDENTEIAYKDYAEFWPLAKQEAIMDDILETLNIE